MAFSPRPVPDRRIGHVETRLDLVQPAQFHQRLQLGRDQGRALLDLVLGQHLQDAVELAAVREPSGRFGKRGERPVRPCRFGHRGDQLVPASRLHAQLQGQDRGPPVGAPGERLQQDVASRVVELGAGSQDVDRWIPEGSLADREPPEDTAARALSSSIVDPVLDVPSANNASGSSGRALTHSRAATMASAGEPVPRTMRTWSRR
jgi:hypothetical protein